MRAYVLASIGHLDTYHQVRITHWDVPLVCCAALHLFWVVDAILELRRLRYNIPPDNFLRYIVHEAIREGL